MKNSLCVWYALSLAVYQVTAAETPPPAVNPVGGPYRVSQVFPVGGAGTWDYLTVDSERHLLFVPRSTHTLVLDSQSGQQVADIPGQKHNHGVALVPAVGRGFITDGDDATVVVFDLKTYHVLGRIPAQVDADGVIYDSASNKVLVVSGDGGTLIPLAPDVDLVKGKADPAIDLGGKPEYLATDGRGRVYVNLTDKNEVAVVNTQTMAVLARWPTAPGGAPVGMSIDREHHRLFIGCRNPRKLIVMDANDGKILADLPIGAGVDATQFDGDIFASCGDGTLTVIRETAPGKFAVIQTVTTPRGARTMGLDPLNHALFLPTAEFSAASGQGRPTPKPNTFMVLKVTK